MVSSSSVPKPVFPSCAKRIHFVICDLSPGWLRHCIAPLFFHCSPPADVRQSCTASLGAQLMSYRHSSQAADKRSRHHREDAVQDRKWSRREVLTASTVSVAGALFAQPSRAAAPPPTAVTPALIDAARKEGKISYYAAIELNVAERPGKM